MCVHTQVGKRGTGKGQGAEHRDRWRAGFHDPESVTSGKITSGTLNQRSHPKTESLKEIK